MRSLALALALAAGALGLAAGQTATAPSPSSPLRIGFVDLDEALRGSAKAKADLEELRKSFEPRLAEFKARAEELTRQQKELAILNRDSEEYYQRRRDLDAELMKLEADDKRSTRVRGERTETIKLGAYEEIRKAAAEVAAARGLDAVLRIDKTDPAEARGLEERSDRARTRMVLSFRPDLDITPEVIRLLNR